tara:strand:+ start:722 stop:952 length:231 start_codon:yes stop_codon:yes gene_type:complete
MGRATNHQVIWKREGQEHDDLVLEIPKVITSDIGFQLMFGVATNYYYDEEQEQKHHENSLKDTKVISKEDLKILYK